MNQQGIMFKAVAIIVFGVAVCASAQAQKRVFVSGVGDDANPCSRTAPCRTFQRGYNLVLAGGEVVALDSAGFGAVSITKSVTLTGEGVYAGITATSSDGIDVDSASAVVILRNLSIYGPGGSHFGIGVFDAASLHVENCVIQGFSVGLAVASANSGIQTFVKDTVMRNNGEGNDLTTGKAIFENCRFEKNFNGLDDDGAKVTLHNCVVAGNSNHGLGATQASSQMMVDNCQVSNNETGISIIIDAQARVSNSEITNNTTGLDASFGGKLLSRISNGVATNTVEDNGTNGAFTGTYSAQ